MRRIHWFIATGAAVALATGLTLVRTRHRPATVAAMPRMTEREIRDLDIAFYERRAA